MKGSALFRREVCLTEYKIQWSDQKICVDCDCGEKDVEIFSESYTYCSKCGRRYTILEIVQVEVPLSEDPIYEDQQETEIEDIGILEYLEKRKVGDKSWDG